MKLARALSQAEEKKVQSFILFGGVFTTLAIWTKLEDPINLPKMFVLVLGAAVVLGLSLPAILSARKFSSPTQQIGLGLISLFGIGLLISTLATEVKYTAIFGEYHRNNGFLSYLAMIILMAAGSLVFNLKSANRYFRFFGIAGLLLSFYGILQGLGKDPVGWKIDYNPFITTLGNPNFTSGFLGLSGIAILYLALGAKDRKYQISYVVGLLANLYILWRSGSIQGIFGFAIGATLIAIVKLWSIRKQYGQIGLFLVATAGTPVVLAILNIGPLASKLYQGSLRNRFDYWSAALGMFKDHPIFGVGIDRFGEYYRQYAVQNQFVQGQVTDNAHSVYLQLLATGGLSVFLPYLFLVLFITFIGLKTLFKVQGKDKLKVSCLIGVWLGTIAVNVVTIDNLGVGVWFWITGGVIVAISSSEQTLESSTKSNTSKQNIKKVKALYSVNEFPFSSAITFSLVLVALVILLPTLSKSNILYNLTSNIGPNVTQSYLPTIVSEANKEKNDPQYLIRLVSLAFKQNGTKEAFDIIDQINKSDPRSFYGNFFAAYANEALGKRSEAIKYRERLKELDPWNNGSLIELVKNYLSVGNKASAAEIAALIKRNYPGSQSDIDASALLVG